MGCKDVIRPSHFKRFPDSVIRNLCIAKPGQRDRYGSFAIFSPYMRYSLTGGYQSKSVGGEGPAGPARPLHVRFVFAPHHQSAGGIARPTAWPAGVEHPDRKRRERERRSGTLWVSSPRGAGNRFIAAFFPVSGIRELSGPGLSQVGPSARLSCAWPITPKSCFFLASNSCDVRKPRSIRDASFSISSATKWADVLFVVWAAMFFAIR